MHPAKESLAGMQSLPGNTLLSGNCIIRLFIIMIFLKLMQFLLQLRYWCLRDFEEARRSIWIKS